MTESPSPLPLIGLAPQAFAAVNALHGAVEETAAAAGLEPVLLELVRLRCSQINGRALHRAARAVLTEQEAALVAWAASVVNTYNRIAVISRPVAAAGV
ncbi:hypothetical protein [Kitasatospora sp. NPDC085879]|uniref:hypothetical protein n=1 Tax=Kitasatospora sp. NPDC085879 TaxID=3154769 RepID=UPI0034338DC9